MKTAAKKATKGKKAKKATKAKEGKKASALVPFVAFVALVPVFAFVAASAAAPGKSGGNFLRIVPSPRVTAMGESGVAISDDLLSALSLNPAGLGRLRYQEVSLIYNRWFEDIHLQHLAYAHPTLRLGTWALSGTIFNVGAFPGYDNQATPTGDVDAQSMAASASWAGKISGPSGDRKSGFFGGLGLRYAREKLENVSANAVMGDAGILYARRIDTREAGIITAGASARCLGQGFTFEKDSDPPPTVYRFGLGYSCLLLGDPFSVAYDITKPSDDIFMQGIGLEYVLKNIVSWRLGFVSNQDVGNGLRFGIGFKLKFVSMDYALAHFGDFGLTHRVGLSIKIGEHIEVMDPQWYINKARKFMKKKRAYQAVLELSEALKLDPHNREALQMLRKARKMVEEWR